MESPVEPAVSYNQVELETLSACPVCGCNHFTTIGTLTDTLHNLEGTFNLASCGRCGVEFLATRPTPSTISYYYPKQYYTHRSISEEKSPKQKVKQMAYDYFYKVNTSLGHKIVYSALSKYINMFPHRGRPSPTMLDFGCGNGTLIETFSRYGFIVDGYEVDEEAAQIAQHYARNIYTGDIFEKEFPEKYDVIILNQVLEHLHDPVTVVRHLVSLLHDDGYLIISVPNASCIDFKILRDCWYACQAPTHLMHYNYDALRSLALLCGVEMVQHGYASVMKSVAPHMIKRHLALIERVKTQNKVLTKSAYLASCFLAFIPWLNKVKSDRLTIYCRKCS